MERKKRRHAKGYVFLPLDGEIADIIDLAAAQLGLTRANLVRILILNYAASLLQQEHPIIALLTTAQKTAKASAKLPAEACVEQGESSRGDEPQLAEITVKKG